MGQFGFLCVPLRLGGEFSLKTAEPQNRRERRDSQRVETDPLPARPILLTIPSFLGYKARAMFSTDRGHHGYWHHHHHSGGGPAIVLHALNEN